MKAALALLSALLVILFLCGHCNCRIVVKGAGDTFALQILQEWNYAFQNLQNFEVEATFTTLSINESYRQLRSSELIWSTTDVYLSPEAMKSSELDDFQQFPVLSTPVAISYNVPEILAVRGKKPPKVNPNSPVDDPYQLLFDRELLSDIYSGTITKWNDKRIKKMNPYLAEFLPNETISVGSSVFPGKIQSVTRALSLVSEKWRLKYGAIFAWPESITSRVSLINLNTILETQAFIVSRPYGLALLVLPFFSQRTFQFAIFPNAAGKFVYPSPAAIDYTVDVAVFNKTSLRLTVGGGNQTDAIPLVTVAYIIAKVKDDGKNCTERREFFKMYRRMLIGNDFRTRASISYCGNMPSHVVEEVLARIENIKCNGVSVLERVKIDLHDDAGIISVFSIIMALFVITVIIILPLFFYKTIAVQTNWGVYFYSSMIFLGAIMSYVAIIWWFLPPYATWVCQLRLWFTACGLSLMLVGVFCRLLGIHYMYFRVYQQGSLRKSLFSPIPSLIVSGLIIAIQLIILILWTSINTFEQGEITVDDLNLEYQDECNSDNIEVWLGIEAGYFALLLLYGIFVLFSTWNIKSSVQESRWVLIACYNCIICLTIVIILVSVMDLDDADLFYMASIPLTAVIISITSAIFLPRFFGLLSSKISSSNRSHGKHATTPAATTGSNSGAE
eukprot:TRINITY_DN680_c0_g1_i2.p1 TRINITY_DN680_c0_g1~~TRINITY_DN680_c0_g1_i2.p1  ORF type:complete len:674 (-),score=194.67 TRINITY_DN680_c0_g1_i2:1290-3311(-)